MKMNSIGRAGVEISALALGGHEYLPDGKSRGFNEDFARAVTPGAIFDGFGAGKRTRVLEAAYAAGINFFDATIDSEKEALGRNLHALPPPYPAMVQTRPEGMGYGYDPYNRKMADYDLLRAEVLRILTLLGRERIDFFNVPFLASAMEHDPDYMNTIAREIAALKEEGLIRFAVADTLSGEATYLCQIDAGCFDAIFINFNIVDDAAAKRVLPAAAAAGMGVFAREAFLKGTLFKMGEEAGILYPNSLAQAALKWMLTHPQITTIVVGADTPEQLGCHLSVLDDPNFSETDHDILTRLQETDAFRDLQAQRRRDFLGTV